MVTKTARHAMILELIARENIETQEELADELRKLSVNVTQATVSRDIKELRLVKVIGERGGGYHYAVSDKSDKMINERMVRIFSESVISMNAADSIIVIKTMPASANAAAETIDNLDWDEIVGTLAGDNTIFVALRSKEQAHKVIAQFHSLMTK